MLSLIFLHQNIIYMYDLFLGWFITVMCLNTSQEYGDDNLWPLYTYAMQQHSYTFLFWNYVFNMMHCSTSYDTI